MEKQANEPNRRLSEEELEAMADRFRLLTRGIGNRHAVLTDGWLDEMSEQFVRMRIREITGASFEQYLEAPQIFECIVTAITTGKAVVIRIGTPYIAPFPRREDFGHYWATLH